MYLDKYRLNGGTALVTGGGRGIGLACVEALAEAGQVWRGKPGNAQALDGWHADGTDGNCG